jgi:hypothetical protein
MFISLVRHLMIRKIILLNKTVCLLEFQKEKICAKLRRLPLRTIIALRFRLTGLRRRILLAKLEMKQEVKIFSLVLKLQDLHFTIKKLLLNKIKQIKKDFHAEKRQQI